MFARIGTRETVNTQIARACEALPGEVHIKDDLDAGTVEATYRETILFRAIAKGGAWIVTYNAEFYPRD
jgi:hypothetical protein